MLWTAVYKSMNGPKLRKLYKTAGCSLLEASAALIYLWQWGLENADETGKILYADESDVENVIYAVRDGSNINVEKTVKAMIDTGWIDKDDDGSLRFHDWEYWQAPWYKAAERRKSDVKRKAEAKAKKEKINLPSEVPQEIPENTEQNESENPPETPLENPQNVRSGDEQNQIPEDQGPKVSDKKPTPKAYKPSFEEFWEAYPRKEGKAEAYKKYMARLNDGWPEEELLRAAKNYDYVVRRNHTEKKYIKQAKTFLSENTPFTDYLPKKKETNPQVPSDANPFAEFKDD